MVVLKCYQRRLLNLFSQFLENADKIPKSKAMGYLPKKGKKTLIFWGGIGEKICIFGMGNGSDYRIREIGRKGPACPP